MSQARSIASHQYLSSRRLFNVFSGAPVHHWRFRSSRKTPAARFHEVLYCRCPNRPWGKYFRGELLLLGILSRLPEGIIFHAPIDLDIAQYRVLFVECGGLALSFAPFFVLYSASPARLDPSR